MSSEKSAGRLLIIEEDALSAEALRQHFEGQGYEVLTAQTGHQGLDLAQTGRPNLILLTTQLPDMSGIEAFQTLRDKPRTGHIPVMMMATHDAAALQNKVLEEGAYDFLEKPLDLDILILRVRNALRRAEREGRTESRSGLPTGRLIDERLELLAGKMGWYKIDLVVDNFSSFRDLYGFVTANEALRFAGNLIVQLVNEHGSADDFVGHVSGTEQFIIVTTQTHGSRLRSLLAPRLNEELVSFYNFIEREQGYVLLEDGAGGRVQKPLMSVQITTTQGDPDPNGPPAQDTPAGDDAWVDAEEDQSGKPDDSASGSPFDW